MFCFLECIGHVRELTGILFHLLYSSSSFCCKQTSHCDPVRRELLYQQGFQILPCLAVDLLFLTDLKFFNISICMWILYISGIWISFPSEMWNREHTSITWSICRTQAFNLYYFRNWIPSLTLVQLSGKPRSLGLGALGGVWLLEESVHALDSLRSSPLLSFHRKTFLQVTTSALLQVKPEVTCCPMRCTSTGSASETDHYT